MASDVSTLIDRLTKAVPTVSLVLGPEYGSQETNYRQRLRQELATQTGQPSVNDLSIRPVLKQGFVSISHCPSLGGFALSAMPVGLDIEVSNRVEERITKRIHHPEDAPLSQPAAIWTAKEAVYKALGPRQPPVITDIAIRYWNSVSSDHLTFVSQGGQGVVISVGTWTVAIFIVVST